MGKNEFSKEFIEKVIQCETAEELLQLAKSEGVKMTLEQARDCLEQFDSIELDGEQLKNIAGGFMTKVGYHYYESNETSEDVLYN